MNGQNEDYVYDEATGEWRPASEIAAETTAEIATSPRAASEIAASLEVAEVAVITVISQKLNLIGQREDFGIQHALHRFFLRFVHRRLALFQSGLNFGEHRPGLRNLNASAALAATASISEKTGDIQTCVSEPSKSSILGMNLME